MPDVYPKTEQRRRESAREETDTVKQAEEPSHEGSIKDNELANAC